MPNWRSYAEMLLCWKPSNSHSATDSPLPLPNEPVLYAERSWLGVKPDTEADAGLRTASLVCTA